MYPFSVTDSFDIAAYGEPEPYAAKITGEILEFLEKLRIPTQSGHCFRSKAASDSDLIRPPIPT